MHCIHCSKEIEGVVDDYTISGRIGNASRCVTECEWCQKHFSVEQISEDTFVIEKANAPIDD